jgi:hypothetical protein
VRSKGPSQADQLLLAELARRRVEVSYAQLERWRYWRRTGLVPRTIQHGRGRGSTSEHEDIEESLTRVAEVAQLRERYRSLDWIALVLTMRGRPLDPQSVKQALLAVCNSGRRQFLSYGNGVENDPLALAHNAARAAKHAGAEALSTGNTAAGQLNEMAVLPAAKILAGAEVSSAELADIVEGSPIAEIAARHGYSIDDVVTVLESHTPEMSFDRMLDPLTAVPPSAVVNALQNAELLVATFIPSDAFTNQRARVSAVIGLTLSTLLQTEP